MICATLLLAALPATAEDWKVGDSVWCEPAGSVRNCRFDKSRIGLSANVTGCREIYILDCKLDDAPSNCQTVYQTVSLARQKGNKQ
ncbi:MAG TPA: hypothetical protein VJZ76_06265 [Thermoanaerobaculia bacterium]|nr:hypothetical protein [Thermoanaerobaculia bacterium]